MHPLYYFLSLATNAALIGISIWSYIRFRDKALKAQAMQANLPQAVKLDDLKARVAAEEKRLHDIQAQMRTQGTQLSDALEAIDAKRKAEEWLALNKPELESIELERQIQRELRASLDQLKAQHAEITSQHRELTRDAAGIDARRSHAKEQLGAITGELAEKTRRLEETQRVVESLQERRSQLRNEVAELDVLSERQKRLDHEVTELAQRKRSLAEEVDAAQLRRSNLDEVVATLSAELERKTSALESVQDLLAGALDQHTTLKAQVAELSALATRHEGLATRHEALLQQVDRLSRQKMELAREVSAGEGGKQQLTAELAELNTNLQEQTQALEEVRTVCESLRDERSQLKADIAQYEAIARRQAELQELVATLLAQRNELGDAVAAGASQKQAVEADLSQLRGELAELARTIEAKRATSESLAEQRATLRAEVAELSELSRRHKEIRQDIAALTQRQSDLTLEVAAAAQQKQHLLAEIAPLIESLEKTRHSLHESRTSYDALCEKQGGLKAEVAELGELSRRHRELRAEVSDMARRQTDLSREVAGAEHQKQTLLTEIAPLRESLDETRRALHETRALHDSLCQKQGELRAEVAELEGLSKQQQSLREQIAMLTEQERGLADRVAGHQAQKQQLESALPAMHQDLEATTRSLHEARGTIESLRERQGVLKADVVELEALALRTQALRQELATLARQQQDAAAAVASSEARQRHMEDTLAPLNSELTEKSRLLQQTRAAFDALSERQGLLKAEVAQLDGLLERQHAAQVDVATLTQQQRELAGIVANQHAQKQQLETQVASLLTDLTQTTQRLDESRRAFDSLCERQGALRAEVVELEGLSQQHKGLRIEVEALAQEQHQLVSTLANQQSQKQQLEFELASLQQSLGGTTRQLTEARAAYEALCEKQGSLKAEVAQFTSLAEQQQVIHKQVEDLTKQQRDLAINVSSRLDQKSQLDEQITAAKADFADVSTRLSEARASHQSLAERHGSLRAEVIELESLADQQKALRTQVAQLTTEQRDLAATVAGQDSQRSQLEQRLVALKTEFDETSTRLGESRSAFDSLCERQGTLKAQVIELEAMALRDAQLREQVAALSDRHAATADAVSQLQSEKQHLENLLAPLRHDLEDKTRLLHDTRISVEAMRERQGALKGEIAELEALAVRQATLRQQVDDLTKQQRELAGTVTQHETRRKQLEEQLAPLTADLSEKTNAMYETRAAVEALAQKQAALKAEVAELEVLAARQKSLQTQVTELTSQHTGLAHAVAAATHQKDALDDQLARISAELGDKTMALEQTRTAWGELREKQSSLKTEVAELEALSSRFRSLQKEVATLGVQQSELSKQVTSADARKTRLDEELALASADLTEKTHALKEAREAVDALQERRAGLRAEVADLESLAKKHASLTQQVDQLSAAKRELDQALMTSEVQRGTAERELASLLSHLAERAKALDETKAAHQTLTQQVGSLRTQVSELSVLAERHAKLQTEVASLSTRHAELDAQLGAVGERKSHRDAELAEVTGALAERRKAMDETSKAVEALKIQRNSLTSEVADLEALATRHHELEQQIALLSDQAKELAHEVGSGQMRRTQLQEKLDTLGKQITEQQDTLKEGRTEIELLREVRGGLKAEVAELTKLSETYQQLKNAVSDLTQKNAKLHIEVASLDFNKTEAQEKAAALAAELADRTKSLHEVRGEYDTLREQHASLKAQVSELSVLSKSRKEESETLGARLGELVQNLQQKSKVLDETKKRHDVLSEEVSGLAARREQLEKTVEVVSDTLKELRLQTGYRGNNAGPLSELWKPALLKSEFDGPRTDDEQACLKSTKKYLNNLGLRFPSRVVNAFHTSLKVSEVSPLVVLAGISGTGKSELARRYAEGMGMHFLNLPVQPRWDSPQDMFGFFNYIENQYRATELARALVQMDPFVNEPSRGWQTPEGWDNSLANRMLVVLLDEMNLARVEYYFSEFLSRLEVRRGIRKGNSSDRRKAEITLEVGMHGATDPTMRLFVDTNVLFVGTINEDETTQMLSEKVVDRANVLAFGKPPRLTDMPRISATNGHGSGNHSEKYVEFKHWQQWIRKDTDLESAAGAQVNRWIEEMNQAMELIRRPFAFRTHAAIRAYAANYPEQGEKGLSFAMADQIEQKILSKFRGLDPNEENVGRSLDRIVSLLDELGDGALISAVESSRRDGTREHQFIFRGVDRSSDLAEVMA